MSSSSLSIAASEANERTPCGRGGGVACECATGTRGVDSGNITRRRWESAGGPESFFWAGGGGGELERGGSSPAAAALKSGRRGDGKKILGVDFAWHAGPGLFFHHAAQFQRSR
jgi:hypothetical protein